MGGMSFYTLVQGPYLHVPWIGLQLDVALHEIGSVY